jgi:hypothetical protein
MGSDIAQWSEWKHDYSLDWHLVEEGPFAPFHQGMQRWLGDLNRFYKSEPALAELDCMPSGFEWIDANDAEQSVVTFLRKGETTGTLVLVACNFTPIPRYGYTVGVPRDGFWREALNSDAEMYGGSNMGNSGGVFATPEGFHGRPCRMSVTLPPLSVVFFVNDEPLPQPEPQQVTELASETTWPADLPAGMYATSGSAAQAANTRREKTEAAGAARDTDSSDSTGSRSDTTIYKALPRKRTCADTRGPLCGSGPE